MSETRAIHWKPTMMAAPTEMTAEQFLGYEVPGKRIELVRGRLLVREPGSFGHGALTLRIGMAIQLHLEQEQQRQGWAQKRGRVAVADPGFTLGRDPDTVRAPDVAYLSRERHSGPVPAGFPELAPDLVVEVRSPTDRPGFLATKVGAWLAAGTDLVWVVDVARAQVIVYRADDSVTVHGVADALDGEAVLPGFRLKLSELFAED